MSRPTFWRGLPPQCEASTHLPSGACNLIGVMKLITRKNGRKSWEIWKVQRETLYLEQICKSQNLGTKIEDPMTYWDITLVFLFIESLSLMPGALVVLGTWLPTKAITSPHLSFFHKNQKILMYHESQHPMMERQYWNWFAKSCLYFELY